MNKAWEEETSQILKTLNDETEKLLHSNLPPEEFIKRHQELMDSWHEASRRIQHSHSLSLKPKARPKHHHHTHHMSEKYQIQKLLSKFHEEN